MEVIWGSSRNKKENSQAEFKNLIYTYNKNNDVDEGIFYQALNAWPKARTDSQGITLST